MVMSALHVVVRTAKAREVQTLRGMAPRMPAAWLLLWVTAEFMSVLDKRAVSSQKKKKKNGCCTVKHFEQRTSTLLQMQITSPCS